MRSRYTAYTRADLDYIRDTSDAEQRRGFSRREAAAWVEGLRFSGLEVFETVAGGPEDDTGVVDFAATYVEGGKTQVLRERSTFTREEGAWRYSGGAKGQTIRRDAPKVGRNDPCPCGSGKKYKKCCGR